MYRFIKSRCYLQHSDRISYSRMVQWILYVQAWVAELLSMLLLYVYVCALSCFSDAARLAFAQDGPQKLTGRSVDFNFLQEEMTTLPSAKYFHNPGQVRTANHQRIVGMFVSYVSNCRCPGLSLNEVWKWHKSPTLIFVSSILTVRSYFVIIWDVKRFSVQFKCLLYRSQKSYTNIRN